MESKFVGELRPGDKFLHFYEGWIRVVRVRPFGSERIIDSDDIPPIIMKATEQVACRSRKPRTAAVNIIEARIDALEDAAQAVRGQLPNEELPSLVARLNRVQRLIEGAVCP